MTYEMIRAWINRAVLARYASCYHRWLLSKM